MLKITYFVNKITFVSVLCLFLTGCGGDDDKKPEIIIITEPPTQIINVKPCTTLYTDINEMFIDSQNNKDEFPELFDESVTKHIVLTKDTKVYISFIAEGAGFTNTFGWYAYDSSKPPKSKNELVLNVLFPNVSDDVLEEGDTRQLGTTTFKTGTAIGLFLIVQGWEEDHVEIKDKIIHFTNTELNPTGQQHIFFKQEDCGDLVLSYEDKPLGSFSDSDFNDLIFTVSDNMDNLEVSSFDLSNVIVK